jgi:predicted AAA+ superfamily ATPase
MDYLNYGSFPVAAKIYHDSEQHDQYLEGVYNTILIKDVASRAGINDVVLLKSIIKFLCSNIGSRVSTATIVKALEASGRKISQRTVDKYLKALTDAFLFYSVDRYDIKGKALLKTLGKYYVVDTGMRNHLLKAANTDIGHQLENIVFLELLRRGYRLNIGKTNEKEIDFIATKADGVEYYQVSASVLIDEVLKRELAPLQEVKDNHPKFLLTLDAYEGNHEGIRQLNLIDWLIGNRMNGQEIK